MSKFYKEVSFDDIVYLKAASLTLDSSKVNKTRLEAIIDFLIDNNRFLSKDKVIVCGHCKTFTDFTEDKLNKCPNCKLCDSFEVYLKTSEIGFLQKYEL